MEKNKIEDFEVVVINSKSKTSKPSKVHPNGDEFYSLSLGRDDRVTATGKIRASSTVKMRAFIFQSSTEDLFNDISYELENNHFDQRGENAKLTRLVISGSWEVHPCAPYFSINDKGEVRLDGDNKPIVKDSIGFFCHKDDSVQDAFRRATRNLRFAPVAKPAEEPASDAEPEPEV